MDSSFKLLLPHLNDAPKTTLLIADENLLSSIDAIKANSQLTIISNRYDVAHKSIHSGLSCTFSDFDFSELENQSFDQILYRISKERPVTNHIINSSFEKLKPKGQLILSGEKNDGIKNYVKAAGKLFNDSAHAEKSGNSYCAVIRKNSHQNETAFLDTKQYPDLRPIGVFEEAEVYSKPGTFGWNKFDQGTQFLMMTAYQYLNDKQLEKQSLLDLGCGYGLITLSTQHWPFIEERWATDNNAAALLCIEKNCLARELKVTITADDCAKTIDKQFDLILCNPPFHQGFDVDSSLTDKFLKQTALHLNPDGEALFVVNKFIGIKQLAQQYFTQITLLTNNTGFNVFALKL